MKLTFANKINLVCLLGCTTGLLAVLSTTGLPGCRGEKKAPEAGKTDTAEKVPLFQQQEFRNELAQKRQERMEQIVIPFNEIRVKLEALVAQARAALPEGASDEQIRTELDGNPEKYPEWSKLFAQAEELAARDKKSRTAAFAELGRRLRAEQGGNK